MKKIFFAFCVLAFAACNNNAAKVAASEEKDTVAKGTMPAAPAMHEEPVAAPKVSDTIHTAATALDIAGTYEGILPCADCRGLKTTLVLKLDSSFVLTEEYMEKGKPRPNNGKWVVNGNRLTLQFSKMLQDRLVQYKIEENKLRQVDLKGNVIGGDMAEKYILTKK